MNLTDDQLTKVRQFGMLQYTARQICLLLRIDDSQEFERCLRSPTTEIYKSYYEGLETARFSMDKILFEEAKKGDTDAYESLKKSQKDSKIDDLKHKIFKI